MKTKQHILLLFLAGLLSLSSCSTDDSVSGNVNPEDGIRIKSMTIQEYTGTEWKDTYKMTNTFTGSNLMMSSSLTQKWNAISSEWVNYSQSQYTLYDSDHASQQILQIWDVTTSSWINQNRHSFTDSASGNRLKTETESWTAGSWKMSSKGDFIYDDSIFLIRLETILWDTTTSSWSTTPENKQVFTNNAQGKPTLTETFIGSDTTPYSKTIFTYDNNGFLLGSQSQITYLGNWVTSTLSDQTNLSNGHPAVINQTNYDMNGNITTKFRYLYAYY